jgi:hypothetical protein
MAGREQASAGRLNAVPQLARLGLFTTNGFDEFVHASDVKGVVDLVIVLIEVPVLGVVFKIKGEKDRGTLGEEKVEGHAGVVRDQDFGATEVLDQGI